VGCFFIGEGKRKTQGIVELLFLKLLESWGTMSLENNKSLGDYLHAGTKAALSSVPMAGNFLSEIFSLVVTQPSEKRKENILAMIDERLNKLAEKVQNFNIEDLSKNEVFLSVVLQASNIALRTHVLDKKAALLNAITNAALSIGIEDSLQQMFLNFIDDFTEWHLRILLLMDDPQKHLELNGKNLDVGMGSVTTLINTVFPELSGNKEFLQQLFNDLSNRGLLSISGSILSGTMTSSGILSPRTTQMGKQFLRYISEPHVIK
jgi:hypothetical protein